MTDTDSFLRFASILQSISLRWSLGLGLHVSLLWTLHQNPQERLLTLCRVRWSLLWFFLPVCFRLRVHLQCLTSSVLDWIWARAAFMAQIPHVQESLHQALHEFCWARLLALAEAGHWEDDVVWLRVVARAVSVWNHRSITAEHLNGGRDLKEELMLQYWTSTFDILVGYSCRYQCLENINIS